MKSLSVILLLMPVAVATAFGVALSNTQRVQGSAQGFKRSSIVGLGNQPRCAASTCSSLSGVGSRSGLAEDEENSIADQLENPATHFLILPGFGNDSSDYTMPQSLVSSLSSRSSVHHPHIEPSQIHVLPLERSEWLNVFTNGIFDIDFWKGDMPPTNPSFRWYLQKIYHEVNQIVTTQVQENGRNEKDVKVVLLGHSAGGWLARAAVGYGVLAGTDNTSENEEKSRWSGWRNLFKWDQEESQVSEKDSMQRRDEIKQEEAREQQLALTHIAGIVTLGAPHIPPPAGVMDMTRGALRITHERFPGAFHHPDIFYITVAGNAVRGVQQQRKSVLEPTSLPGFAYESYLQVSGDGNVWGDGVVPTEFAHLKDINAIEIELDGVAHSITSPDSWYGADGIIDQWLEVVIDELRSHLSSRQNPSQIVTQESKTQL
jgi:hypothetical protein